MNAQDIAITPSENIDSPFSQVTQSLLWDRFAAFRPHLVRRVREFVCALVPPRLITALRLAANDARYRRTA